MSEQNDHDLLIAMNTKLEIMTQNLADFMKLYDNRHSTLSGRVASLEVKDRGDSEKVQAITRQLQETLKNSERITSAFLEINALKVEVQGYKDDIADLKKKSDRNDALNAILATASGVVGFIFGNK
jgi:hypothetical protein